MRTMDEFKVGQRIPAKSLGNLLPVTYVGPVMGPPVIGADLPDQVIGYRTARRVDGNIIEEHYSFGGRPMGSKVHEPELSDVYDVFSALLDG